MIDKYLKALEEAAHISKVALNNTDDWVTIKKIILRSIRSELRTSFSTRDPKTKEQSLNEFEIQLIEKYKELTGITLICRTREERKKLNDENIPY